MSKCWAIHTRATQRKMLLLIDCLHVYVFMHRGTQYRGEMEITWDKYEFDEQYEYG